MLGIEIVDATPALHARAGTPRAGGSGDVGKSCVLIGTTGRSVVPAHRHRPVDLSEVSACARRPSEIRSWVATPITGILRT